MYSICILYVLYMYYICIIYVFYMYSICIIYVLYMYYICIIYVLYMYYICIIYVLYMYYICIIYVLYMYYICIIYVLYMYYIILYMYYICIIYVLYMYYICIIYVLYMYYICIIYVLIIYVLYMYYICIICISCYPHNSPMNFHIFFWVNPRKLCSPPGATWEAEDECAPMLMPNACAARPQRTLLAGPSGKHLEGIGFGRDFRSFDVEWDLKGIWWGSIGFYGVLYDFIGMNLEQTHSWWPSTYWSWNRSWTSTPWTPWHAASNGLVPNVFAKTILPQDGHGIFGSLQISGPFGSSLWKKSSLYHLTINHGIFSVFHQIHAFS